MTLTMRLTEQEIGEAVRFWLQHRGFKTREMVKLLHQEAFAGRPEHTVALVEIIDDRMQEGPYR